MDQEQVFFLDAFSCCGLVKDLNACNQDDKATHETRMCSY